MPLEAKVEFKPSFDEKFKTTKARNAMNKAVNEVLLELNATLKEEVPVSKTSHAGYLRDSHSTEVKSSNNEIEGLVHNSAHYWKYVQFGTSRMDANPWITRSIAIVEPRADLERLFRLLYKP